MGLTRRHRGGSPGFRSGFTEGAAHHTKPDASHKPPALKADAPKNAHGTKHADAPKKGGGAGIGMLALPWGMVALDRWAGQKYGKKKSKSRRSRGGARRRTHRRRTRHRRHRRRTHHRRRRTRYGRRR